MLRVGLTGGIGSGKSLVAARLAELGASLIDSDALAREVVRVGSPGLAAVATEFGPGVICDDGSLDRAQLAQIVFADPTARARLEHILHPRIADRAQELFAQAAADVVVVHDVPLLVELGYGDRYHLVVVTDAPVDTRVERLVSSRGMDRDDALARIDAQAGPAERAAAGDVVIDNGGSRESTLAAVDELWATRLVPFEKNLGTGTPAPRSGTVTLSAPDPTWPAQAARLLARIRRAVGDNALSLEHIGSTAVPGLAAKDVIDIQLVVPSLVVGEALREPLTQAGFVWVPGQQWDDEPDGRVERFFHVSADPGRQVNVQVRTDGATARNQIATRDWLIANPAERDAYQAFKVGEQGGSLQQYTEAKQPWIRRAFRRANR